MTRRTPPHIAQYEHPTVPGDWGLEARRFAEQLRAVLDDIYRRYGRLRMEDMSTDTRALIQSFAGQSEVSGLAQALGAVADRLGALMSGTGVLDALPLGTWLPFSGEAPPSPKWLFAQGQHLDPALYPLAHALFGGTMPDARGRMLAGLDTLQGEFIRLHQTGGEKCHALTEQELPAHTHTQEPHNHTTAYGTVGGTGGAAAAAKSGTATYNAAATAINQPTGGGQPHNNLPPYLTVQYIVKVMV